MSQTDAHEARMLSLTALRHDLRFARRMLVKSPLFTGIVVLTLALGIGLNTAVFSLIDTLLLRPLPGVANANGLMQLYRSYPGLEFGSNSIPHYQDVRRRTTDSFDGVLLWGFSPFSVTASDRPVTVLGQIVSANYFSVLGINASKGRTFVAAEDEGRGAHPIAVLSDRGWRTLFGADPKIIGRQVPLNGQNIEIVGVTPPGFRGALPLVDPLIWLPLMQLEQAQPGSRGNFENRSNNSYNIVGRLKAGVSVQQLRARMQTLDVALRSEYPDSYTKSSITVVPQADAGVHPTMRGAQIGLTAVVGVVVGLLLLLACVNVANLFLARSRDRAREMAIRLALGARRGALVRQLLVESIVFALISGLAGVLVAWWTIRVANGVTLPMDIDFQPDLRLSPVVLGFSLGVSVLTGILFGLAPALRATRPELVPALRGEAPAGGSRSRTSKVLIVAQMALSLVLLVCASLFLANLRLATTIDKGFVSRNALIAELDPGLQGYTRAATDDFYRRLAARVAANPLVRAVAYTDRLPLGLNTSDSDVDIPGYVPAEKEGMSIYNADVGPGYFAAMEIPMLKGRDFAERDDSAGTRVVVVNQRFVDRFWPGQDGLGRTFRQGGRDRTVIGVVPTGKYVRLGEDPTAHMWFPLAQRWQSGITLVIRTVGDPAQMIAALRSEVQAMDANLPLSNVRTLEKHLGIALLPARLAGAALGIFGLLGLVLASVGMYGVMAYSVAQRTREIGIRMAIGAAASDIIRLVMRQGLTLALLGALIGLAGAFAASRLLGSVLYGGSALDPTTFTVVPLVLIAVAALATFVPARRASLVDPALCIRAD